MSDSFRALRLNKTDDGQSHEIIEMGEDALMDGDVTVAVSHSTLITKTGWLDRRVSSGTRLADDTGY